MQSSILHSRSIPSLFYDFVAKNSVTTLLSEAVGLAGDVLATPGGLLDVHGGDDADDDLLGDVDIDPARVDGV